MRNWACDRLSSQHLEHRRRGTANRGGYSRRRLALAFFESESALLLPAMCIAGMIGGFAWAAVPAFLKTRFGTNEILVSLMLTYVLPCS